MIEPQENRVVFAKPASQSVFWPGRSGRRYAMVEETGTSAPLVAGRLYLMAEKGVVRWAGTLVDLIEDQASRARFRKASANGAALFSMPAPPDELTLMTLVWDLEGTRNLEARDAA